ncbi:MAG: transposase [Rhodobacteraceae bacterium]|nr:transposase [Paracoccaceae bacterium]
MTSVLHTGCSTMTHHPHVHVIVPSGGLSPDGTRWIARRPGLFLPVKVL